MSKRISLILGSGGARGVAHIGVIRELERQGFQINAIAGCSMGALIGGFYCADRLDIFEDWVINLNEWDVLKFLDVSLTPKAGMMKGDLIIDTLREMVGDTTIEELPLPFTAVATDIVARKEVWLNSGDLFDAVRASIAIPGLFTPKIMDGRTLVDGGLLNPLPGAPAMFNDSEMSIAVSLSGLDMAQPYGDVDVGALQTPMETYRGRIEKFMDRMQQTLGLEKDADETPELRLTDVMLGTFDTMQAAIARHRLASYPPDLLIEIPGNICQIHEFYKARALIEAGRYWARQALDMHSDRL